MNNTSTLMNIAKDQFWSWTMISLWHAEEERELAGQASVFSFFLARNAIYHSLRLLDIPRGANVLAPAYVCRAAIDPLLAYGLNVSFYAVKQDCRPDFDDIEQKITEKTKAVLVAHYFGFPAPVRRLRDLCDKHGLSLIEDCAHVLC